MTTRSGGSARCRCPKQILCRYIFVVVTINVALALEAVVEGGDESGFKGSSDLQKKVQAALPTRILRYIFKVAPLPAGDDVSRIGVDIPKGPHLAVIGGAEL
jgi:hypothetical protein